MKAIEIRNKYINFFESKNHKYIKSVSLVPENDTSVLFTTAGMQPLIPYLLGQTHPEGNRIVNYQKCLRTNDIEDVGDNRHLTFFEMLGNWSLGDYFKKEAIEMSYEFLTKHLNIPNEKISVTCFAGDNDAPKDEESAGHWKRMGIPEERIYFFTKKDNWWIAGDEGPCGPDTEMFYDTGKPKCSENCNPACGCGKYVEIWNNVFMQYYKSKDGIYSPLKQQNVDTGFGLERATMLLQGKKTPYEIEIFEPIMSKLEELAIQDNLPSRRIVTEHLRSSIMLISDGVLPSNVDKGYILRRLIRRAVRHMNKLEIDLENISQIIEIYFETLKELYPEIIENKIKIISVIIDEKDKFLKTLINGEKELLKEIKKAEEQNINNIDGEIVFKLYDTYGFPPEMTKELANEHNLNVDLEDFEKYYKQHQETSRTGSIQKFKGGLAEQNEKTFAYHTATHLLHKALKIVLGEHVKQSGSNITEERLRFDFSHPTKMTPEEIQKVEQIVNEQIEKKLDVICEEVTLEQAKQSGAIGLFENKYGEKVTVYTIGDFSKEICGGPHVNNTYELGKFKIKKEESSSSGIRRIKAILE